MPNAAAAEAVAAVAHFGSASPVERRGQMSGVRLGAIRRNETGTNLVGNGVSPLMSFLKDYLAVMSGRRGEGGGTSTASSIVRLPTLVRCN